MTGSYGCYQNVLAGQINGILKNEFLLKHSTNLLQTREMLKESVTIYNHKRPHLPLKYKTPGDVHQGFYRQKSFKFYQVILNISILFYGYNSVYHRILLRFKICLSYVPHTHLNYKGNCHEKYHVVLALARGRLCV